jgi:hypothetical protein
MTSRSQSCINFVKINGKSNHELSFPIFLIDLSDVIGRDNYDRPFANVHDQLNQGYGSKGSS